VIHYTLSCDSQHRFDGWFKNAEAFDQQVEQGIVTCPVCASVKVEKALMAPAIARSSETSMPVAAPDPAQVRAFMRAMREKVMAEADYVGPRFAEEARKIHYNEAEQRGIYGEATRDEVTSLLDEGIEFLPLPDIPEEHN